MNLPIVYNKTNKEYLDFLKYIETNLETIDNITVYLNLDINKINIAR